MKILVLVTIATWSFGFDSDEVPASRKLVNSPEAAAVLVWKDKQAAVSDEEQEQKQYRLYEVDLENETIKEVSIPRINFKVMEKLKKQEQSE
jgi:hypothetical protein